MNAEDGAELILKAVEKRSEDKAWDLYLTFYPDMDEKNFIPFDQFYNPHRGKEEKKSKDEILQEVKGLLDNNSWR